MSKYTLLKEMAYKANMQLTEFNLVILTWGNVSVADHDQKVFAIKPSGVPYDKLKVDDIVIVDFNGNVVEGNLRPSSDTPTHAVLYKEWGEKIGSVVHTHSTHATAWAQTQLDIPIMGTTHADHTTYDIPCAAPMSDEMIEGDYEYETGIQILDELKKRNIKPEELGMILVGNHGPFSWGKTPETAVYNSVVLENIAKMAYISLQVNPKAPRLKETLIRKHYDRKHGKNAYYGQPK